MNVLDLSGPEFMELYLCLLFAAFLACAALRWALRQPGGPPPSGFQLPSPHEAALLRGNMAAVEAALASLFHHGCLRINDDTLVDTLVTSEALPSTAPLIERAVYDAVKQGYTRPAELVHKVEPTLFRMREPLVQRGWLVDETWSFIARWVPRLPCFVVLLMGLAKFQVGLERGRPVGWLVLTTLVAGVMLFKLTPAPWRSRRGDAVLQWLREKQEPLKQTALSATSASALTHREAAMAVALYGMTALGYTEFELLRRHLLPPTAPGLGSSSSGGGDGGSGWSDGGGCGSGGGGDSGGGGGGCGGCGGGGGD